MLSQIHDELLFEIKNNSTYNKHVKEIKTIMENILSKININSLLNTSVNIGTKWGMLKEIEK